MSFAFFLLAGLATAARYCVEPDPPVPINDPTQPSLPACTTKCLALQTSTLDGVCADNLQAIYFARTLQYYCDWLPTITSAQAEYFGQWDAYLYNKSATTSSQIASTVTQQVTSFVTLSTPATPEALSASPSTDASSTTSTSAATSADGLTSLLIDVTSSTGRTSTTTISRSAAPSLALAQVDSQPALNTSTIAGVTVGDILALSLIGGGVFFLLRRRRRYLYEPDNGKLAREKAGLDEPYSGVVVGGLVGFAELKGSSPVSPVMEPPVHLSAIMSPVLTRK